MKIVPQKQQTKEVVIPSMAELTFTVKIFDYDKYGEFIDSKQDAKKTPMDHVGWLLENGLVRVDGVENCKEAIVNEDGNLILNPRAMDILAGEIQKANLVVELGK